MATTCKADLAEENEEIHPQVPVAPQTTTDLNNIEFDFVEEPSQDFFCPVTLELLTDPHQTTCCGNHLSQKAANTLQRDGKPCPMCKDPQLATIPDKFHKRRVSEIKVRCPHKKGWCEWVGGINEVKQHSDSCPKRPWQCQYCEFETTYNTGVNEHLPVCNKYPVVCPNSCEVGSVPRCGLEAHLMVCPLQPVTCEYAEVGCDVKVPRRDLGRHMEEGQQQHLLSATLLNLRLTRENTEEKNRLLRMIEERDQQIKEKDNIFAELQKQLKQVQGGLEAKVTDLQQQVVKYGEDTQERLKQQDKHLEYSSVRLGFNVYVHIHLPYIQQGFSLHDFTLTEFKKCQAIGDDGDWYSDPFYSHPGGYKFQLNVETNGNSSVYMRVWFLLSEGDHDDELDWPVSITAHVQLLNQLGDHNHHEKTSTGWWRKNKRGSHFGKIEWFIKFNNLEFDAVNNSQYLKNDCLCFRVYMKALPK